MKNVLILSLLLFSALCWISCGDDSPEEIRQKDMEEIERYINDNNLDAQSTASGLHYVIEQEGNGQHPTINDEVTVHYHGYLTNGDVFDSSVERNQPISFGLRQVIEGWQEGIPLFSKGGKGKLLIPSHLGYGSRSQGGIPANSVLIFDVELIDF